MNWLRIQMHPRIWVHLSEVILNTIFTHPVYLHSPSLFVHFLHSHTSVAYGSFCCRVLIKCLSSTALCCFQSFFVLQRYCVLSSFKSFVQDLSNPKFVHCICVVFIVVPKNGIYISFIIFTFIHFFHTSFHSKINLFIETFIYFLAQI